MLWELGTAGGGGGGVQRHAEVHRVKCEVLAMNVSL